MLEGISIIIPLAPDEASHERLLDDLKDVKAEIICSSEGSRATSLNAGARKAKNDFLWFLHADSRLDKNSFSLLEQSLNKSPSHLHYFDLAFEGGGLPNVNALGANLRSRILGIPFGDQGFFISKINFKKIGGFPEECTVAEDLLFLWKARRLGINPKRIPATITTSPRKYKERGWLKLTALYQWIWIKISIPQAWKLLRGIS